jgi:hypothetical protein
VFHTTNLEKGCSVADDQQTVGKVIHFPRPKFGQEEPETPSMTYEEGIAFCLAYAEAQGQPIG